MSELNTAYNFVQLGEDLATTMVRAAEDQVSRAQQILEQAVSMADIIRSQVHAQAQQIEETNERFRAFGSQILSAHRILNGETPLVAPAAAQPRIADRDRDRIIEADVAAALNALNTRDPAANNYITSRPGVTRTVPRSLASGGERRPTVAGNNGVRADDSGER